MMFAALVDLIMGLWWVAVTSSVLTVFGICAAWLGVIPRLAGMVASSAVGCIAASYWFDIIDIAPQATADMRRGAGVILWPAIAWCVAWLLRVARKADEHVG